ncbi:MAG TPA: hypothetical protein VGR37_13100, partial [Longimicrobiaceae bacterium]|nr:hypothetical protein [Longimicrobiaceae bacterium]
MSVSAEPQIAVPGIFPDAQGRAVPGLPVSLTRFVGRAEEVALVRELLAGTRLLTLTGPGGSGKTRLALEVARGAAVAEGREVWWVELAGLSDGAHVAQAVATALRIAEEPGRAPEDRLADVVGDRPGLLVLDNCEHVVDACARLADRLLRACPRLQLAATSREALGVTGETAWLVPPLSLPPDAASLTAASLEGSEAVELFVERARAVVPTFGLTDANAAAVARICRRLDGVPLAIELAAARVKVLAPAQIVERLDDCFAVLVHRGRTALPRHQTIRATIDWSYELLSPPERLLLQRLSVFAGGFTLEAAEAVCPGDGIEEWEVLDLLAALVERSLVVMRERGETARYQLLEVVRQYAAGCMAETGAEAADAVARRHARFFAELAEAAGPRLYVLEAPELLDVVRAEHDNLRGALEWSLRRGVDAELALRLSGGLWPFWLHRGHWSEGVRWMDEVLAAAGPPCVEARAARAILGAGALGCAIGDLQRSRERLEEAERLWRALADPRALALNLSVLAQLHVHLGDNEVALLRARESVATARQSGDPYVLSFTLSTALGFVHAFRGEAAQGDGYCGEGQEIALREGYQWGVLFASFSRAMIAWMGGDLDGADVHATACVRAMHRLDNPWFVPRALIVPAAVALHRGELPRAARLLGAAETQCATIGARLMGVEQPLFDGLLASVREALGEDGFARAWAEGAALGEAASLAEAEG